MLVISRAARASTCQVAPYRMSQRDNTGRW